MKRYLLDTNICIFYMKGKYDLLARFEKAGLRQRGELIDDFDLLIGSAAVHHNLVMVTENVRHLARIPGIRVENWIQR